MMPPCRKNAKPTRPGGRRDFMLFRKPSSDAPREVLLAYKLKVAKQATAQKDEKLRDVRWENAQLKRDAKIDQRLMKDNADTIEELRLQLTTLQDELDEVKEDALDQLNDRSEVVGRLMQRAAPEGWRIVSLARDGWLRQVHGYHDGGWRWGVLADAKPGQTVAGVEPSMAAAVKAAEAVQVTKCKPQKKAKR